MISKMRVAVCIWVALTWHRRHSRGKTIENKKTKERRKRFVTCTASSIQEGAIWVEKEEARCGVGVGVGKC